MFKCYDCCNSYIIEDQDRAIQQIIPHPKSIEHVKNMLARIERRNEDVSQKTREGLEVRILEAELDELRRGRDRGNADPGPPCAARAMCTSFPSANLLSGDSIVNSNIVTHTDAGDIVALLARLQKIEGIIDERTNDSNIRIEKLRARTQKLENEHRREQEHCATRHNAAIEICEALGESLERKIKQEATARQRVLGEAAEAIEKLEKEIKSWAEMSQIQSKRLSRELGKQDDKINEIDAKVSALSSE